MQCTSFIPKVHDVYIFWYDRRNMEVFMDDFSVYGKTFDDCLGNLDKVLQRCEEKHLVLNWENVISWLEKA